MGAETRIEWADHTFNPWTGCQAVSPACDHCYAEAQAKRNTSTFGGWGPHAERKRTSESYWRQPLKWNSEARRAGTRPRVFCASMADIMDKAAPLAWFIDALDLMRITQHVIWLLLTKRPQIIRRRLEDALAHLAKGTDRGDLIEWIALWLDGHPPENVWLGTTVENQAEADRRIPHLLAMPAARRFLSCEPLLGPLNLHPMDLPGGYTSLEPLYAIPEGSMCDSYGDPIPGSRGRIDWVIAGGESGPKARPSHPDWFRSLRDQCQAAGVPFFFKQWGEWAPGDAFGMQQDGPIIDQHGNVRDWMRRYVVCEERADRLTAHSFTAHATNLVYRVGKQRAGATLDGREWREVPRG